jgi:dTDP-4-amino-4,6-dideoxygalactose transaminase
MEGGALIVNNEALKNRIDYLKNFGITDEMTVVAPGINGKMNEVQAAFGLLHLRMVEDEIVNRRNIAQTYRQHLADIAGISFLNDLPEVGHNYAYFPILVESERYGLSRDDLYDRLQTFNIFSRKYFYPLCTHYPFYSSLPSASPALLPVAERVGGQVLCLPIYGSLQVTTVIQICHILKAIQQEVKDY